MTSLIVTNPNESYSEVARSNRTVFTAVSVSEDEVVAEVNEAYGSTQNEALYEECDDSNYQCHSSTYVSTTENVAYGQNGRAAQSEIYQSKEDVDYY